MLQNEHLAVIEPAQRDAHEIADAHIDRHAHAADGTVQDDAFAMQFDAPDAAVGAGIMRFETKRK
jgi:hypothetical protein